MEAVINFLPQLFNIIYVLNFLAQIFGNCPKYQIVGGFHFKSRFYYIYSLQIGEKIKRHNAQYILKICEITSRFIVIKVNKGVRFFWPEFSV